MTGPRRLIEVDLPIREISKEARREKSIRHGHISTLHIWWARRPLAACRSVVLAALLPDPEDPDCSSAFRISAAEALRRFRDKAGGPPVADSPEGLRKALLAFIARFAGWEASTDSVFLDCARALVAAAHPDGPPLVVDPFAGGGAIPLEALRVGADAWAGDYNPVAALLLRVVLEDVPRYGEELAEGVRKWGEWVKARVEADIGRFYPPDPDGAIPIAYIWARTVICEGPACGAEIPLFRQLWLSKRGRRQTAVRLVVDGQRKRIDFEVDENPDRVTAGTVRRGSAVCPVCHIVTPVARVRAQAKAKGGLRVRMVAVVRTYLGQKGRHYRVADDRDVEIASHAEKELRLREKGHQGELTLVPDEPFPAQDSRAFTPGVYGVRTWGDLFLPRQALTLTAFAAAVREAHTQLAGEATAAFARAVATVLALTLDRLADLANSLCAWEPIAQCPRHLFTRQAVPIVWDFAEGAPLSDASGSWDVTLERTLSALESVGQLAGPGQTDQADSRAIPFPTDSVPILITDPPYYDAVPYSDLSDFFYVWLRRSVGSSYGDLLATPTTPKLGEIVVNPTAVVEGRGPKDRVFFEAEMSKALAEARRVLAPDGVAVVVFAHKTTSGWEAMLQALINAGWTVTGSWPLDTEMAARLRARDSAALASSVHIVCRPRPDRAGVGEWRRVREELERRVADWLPRLSREGIEGADAIFACLGPAMEVYSRFESVETAGGTPVPLSPPPDDLDAAAFLPAVWSAVAKRALQMIFEGPEAEGFEEDARLTALWLWTLKAVQNGRAKATEPEEDEDSEEDEGRTTAVRGLTLDYDTARKLAQALGVHLEDLGKPGGIVEVRKGIARLRPVAERRSTLLVGGPPQRSRAGTLFEPEAHAAGGEIAPGNTTLDRLHQAMLLFAGGRGDTLRRLLADASSDGEGLRRLARVLSALYPGGSQEKRWVDGVLAVMRQVEG